MSAIIRWLDIIIGLREGALDEDGQTMVEYGLILAGVALIVVTTIFLLGGAIQSQFQAILDQLSGA